MPKKQTHNKEYEFQVRSAKNPIELKSQTKYLGIMLDEHMTIKENFTIPRQKFTRATAILVKLGYILDILKSVYITLFLTLILNILHRCEYSLITVILLPWTNAKIKQWGLSILKILENQVSHFLKKWKCFH